MNKTDFVAAFAAKTGTTKKEALIAVDTLLGIIAAELQAEREVVIPDFGKFYSKEVPEHQAVIPGTDKKVTVEAHRKVMFKPFSCIMYYSNKHERI